jgi:thiamine biosynthesis lipoprotein ApbE
MTLVGSGTSPIERGHDHEKDTRNLRPFTTGMAVVTVVAHNDQAMADSASAAVVYPEQASDCDGTSC